MYFKVLHALKPFCSLAVYPFSLYLMKNITFGCLWNQWHSPTHTRQCSSSSIQCSAQHAYTYNVLFTIIVSTITQFCIKIFAPFFQGVVLLQGPFEMIFLYNCIAKGFVLQCLIFFWHFRCSLDFMLELSLIGKICFYMHSWSNTSRPYLLNVYLVEPSAKLAMDINYPHVVVIACMASIASLVDWLTRYVRQILSKFLLQEFVKSLRIL